MSELTECRAESDYSLWLRFDDGVHGRVYLGDLVGVGVFAAWRDIENFRQVSVDADSRTVCWEGGIDIAQELLYQGLVNRSRRTMMH
ncbi:MAG TPA: DUF2442 domain-containing protein [Burkholderiales bacterium]|nr:DUF2442 domain-containing protein [Burkholderiales bacterium]